MSFDLFYIVSLLLLFVFLFICFIFILGLSEF